MSHKKTIQTEYKDAEALEEAFREAAEAQGFTVEFGNLNAKMYNGSLVPVAMCVRRNHDYSSLYYSDCGIARDGERFTIIVDDLDAERYKMRQFLNDIAQRYTYKVTLKTLKAQGYAVTEDRQADGTIKLVARPTRRTASRSTATRTTERRTVAVRR